MPIDTHLSSNWVVYLHWVNISYREEIHSLIYATCYVPVMFKFLKEFIVLREMYMHIKKWLKNPHKRKIMDELILPGVCLDFSKIEKVSGPLFGLNKVLFKEAFWWLYGIVSTCSLLRALSKISLHWVQNFV